MIIERLNIVYRYSNPLFILILFSFKFLLLLVLFYCLFFQLQLSVALRPALLCTSFAIPQLRSKLRAEGEGDSGKSETGL